MIIPPRGPQRAAGAPSEGLVGEGPASVKKALLLRPISPTKIMPTKIA